MVNRYKNYHVLDFCYKGEKRYRIVTSTFEIMKTKKFVNLFISRECAEYVVKLLQRYGVKGVELWLAGCRNLLDNE